MNKFIEENDEGLEVGSGAGFAKYFIKNKNFKISDFSNDEHLDYKKMLMRKIQSLKITHLIMLLLQT